MLIHRETTKIFLDIHCGSGSIKVFFEKTKGLTIPMVGFGAQQWP